MTPRLRRLALLIAVLLPVSAFATDPDDTVELDLPSGPLLGCLEQLTARTGVPIVDSTGRVADLACTARHEVLSLANALDALLKPAGLAWRRRDDGAIEVVEGRKEQIELDALSVEDTPLPSIEPVIAASAPMTRLAQESMSITRITQERLETAPLLSLSQINRYAPNVYASGAGLAIRAVERDLDTFSGLAIRLDDIDLGTSLIDGDMISVENLASLDLERGPRSFERGGPGAAGALNLYTAAPAETPTLRAGFGLGNDGAHRASASWSGRFGDSESGLRVALENRRLPNYVDEQFVPQANRAHREVDNLFVKLNLVPESIPGLSAEVSALVVSGDDAPLWTSANESPFPLPEHGESYARVVRSMRTRAVGAATNVQYGSDAWYLRLTANSTVAQHRGAWVGSTFGPAGIFNTERRRATGLSGHHHTDNWDFAVGAELSGLSFSDQDAIWATGYQRVADYRKDLDFRTRSVWAWIERRWGDTWAVGGGVRQVKERTRRYIISAECDVGELRNPQPGVCTDLSDDAPLTQFGQVSTSTPVPLVVGRWTPLATQTFTLSYGRGIRSSLGLFPEWIQPAERDDSAQIGWQANWLGGDLTTRTAVFHTKVSERFHFVNNHIGARGLARGAELEAEYRLSRLWRLNAGAGWIDADFQYYRYGNTDPTPPMPGAPERTVLVGARYGDVAGWYGTIDAYRVSEAESAQEISPKKRRPAYNLVDFRVGYRKDEWELALLVTNAFDQTYLDRVDFSLNDRFYDTRYRLGDPRRTELRWQYEWK